MSSARPRARTPNPAPCARRRKLMAAVRFRAASEAQSIAYTPTNSARRADWARGRTGECLDGGGDEQERERSGPEERHCCALFTEEAACVNVHNLQIFQSLYSSSGILKRAIKRAHKVGNYLKLETGTRMQSLNL